MLGGKSLTEYVASGGARSLFLISNDYMLPYSWNTTAGVGWQLNRVTSLDVDYVHDLGLKQLGAVARGVYEGRIQLLFVGLVLLLLRFRRSPTEQRFSSTPLLS